MTNSSTHRHGTSRRLLPKAGAILPLCMLLAFVGQFAQAQTFTAIHIFTGGNDGGHPGDLAMDRGGNLYGSAQGNPGPNCFTDGCGVVFQLKHSGTQWIYNRLYGFQGSIDGAFPGPVVFGPDGDLYGVANVGGSCTAEPYGCGMVFKLSPPPAFCKTSVCPWTKTVVYNFNGGSDGSGPGGPLVFGPDGSIYGVTAYGGAYDGGVVFKLTPSHGGWSESVLASFNESYPQDGVTLDAAGNIYGVTFSGGARDYGTVYELSPSGSGWIETILHDFGVADNDGTSPNGGLILDHSGNLLGSTSYGPGTGGGVFFSLSPGQQGWTENVLYDFSGRGGPHSKLTMDAAGNLYGTTFADGPQEFGTAFKLTYSNGSWTYRSLHNFTYNRDGAYPESNLIFDAQGNLYGTTYFGADYDFGLVFQITP